MTKGGKRAGAGKKKLDPGDKLEVRHASLLPRTWAAVEARARATDTTVQGVIREAVDKLLSRKK